jgi:hypothetical protein
LATPVLVHAVQHVKGLPAATRERLGSSLAAQWGAVA